MHCFFAARGMGPSVVSQTLAYSIASQFHRTSAKGLCAAMGFNPPGAATVYALITPAPYKTEGI